MVIAILIELVSVVQLYKALGRRLAVSGAGMLATAGARAAMDRHLQHHGDCKFFYSAVI